MGSSLLELNQREACRGVSVNVRGLAGDRCGGPVGVLVDGGAINKAWTCPYRSWREGVAYLFSEWERRPLPALSWTRRGDMRSAPFLSWERGLPGIFPGLERRCKLNPLLTLERNDGYYSSRIGYCTKREIFFSCTFPPGSSTRLWSLFKVFLATKYAQC